MRDEIVIAGFGGQGVLLAGMILSQAALEQDMHTTWFPSYGAEIRGGTANSTVVISDDDIGSPVIESPHVLIALNKQSLMKFINKMKAGSLIIANSSLIKDELEAKGIEILKFPFSDMAHNAVGNIRTANLIALGVYLKYRRSITMENAKKACAKAFKENSKLIELNNKALETGFNLLQK